MGLRFLVFACVGLTGFALTPTGTQVAIRSTELSPGEPTGHEKAIVLLTGDMARLPAAIDLHSRTRLPVIVSGASSQDYVLALKSTVNAMVLVEDKSRDTEQNAAYSSCLVTTNNLDPVFIVTDAIHMRRAVAWFHYYGVSSTPWPTHTEFAGDLIGSTRQLGSVLHEWLGLLELGMRKLLRQKTPCQLGAAL